MYSSVNTSSWIFELLCNYFIEAYDEIIGPSNLSYQNDAMQGYQH